MIKMLSRALAIVVIIGTASVTFAEETKATKAYIAAMSKAMSMDVEISGDADVDFIKMMILHQQGAIDIAKIELQYGQDPDAKRKAQEIIDAHEKEADWMNEWLETRPK